MPTPRDSTDELPLQLETTSHTSCPPELSDRPTQWSQQVLGDMEHAIADVANRPEQSRRIQTVAPDIANPELLAETYHNSTPEKMIEHPAADLPADMIPSLIAASPQSFNDEEKEPERLRTTGAIPSPANLAYSISYGIESPRVLQSCTLSRSTYTEMCEVYTNPFVVQTSRR